MDPTPAPHALPAPWSSPFGRVVAGVNGSRADAHVVRQAAILAGPATPLDLVAVAWEQGTGLSAQATLTREHADRALAAAERCAHEAGARPRCRRLEAADAGSALRVRTGPGDLLVLGASRNTRFGGAFTGRPATRALHLADCAVLIARLEPPRPPFPGPVLLADDGRETSQEAARIATAVAARHGTGVIVAAPPRLDADGRSRVAAHRTAILRATGEEPIPTDMRGAAHEALPRLAEDLGTGLLVLGSRRLPGLLAAASVSERVAHAAPCSVLVARAGAVEPLERAAGNPQEGGRRTRMPRRRARRTVGR